MSEEFVKHWMDGSEEDFETMIVLYNNGRNTGALFFGHLLIEKLFKALFAKLNPDDPHAPKIHNLIRLATLCGLELTSKQTGELGLINRFNIDARYEDTKKEFYKLCTKEFAKEQVEIIKEFRQWLKTKLT